MHKPQVSEKLLETISVSMFWAQLVGLSLPYWRPWFSIISSKRSVALQIWFYFFKAQALEQSAEEIGKTATSGRFLDPNENPKSVVQSLREVRGVIARKPCLGHGMCLLPSITQGKANFCITHKPFFSALSCVHCSVANFFVSLHTLHPVFVLHACNFRFVVAVSASNNVLFIVSWETSSLIFATSCQTWASARQSFWEKGIT